MLSLIMQESLSVALSSFLIREESFFARQEIADMLHSKQKKRVGGALCYAGTV